MSESQEVSSLPLLANCVDVDSAITFHHIIPPIEVRNNGRIRSIYGRRDSSAKEGGCSVTVNKDGSVHYSKKGILTAKGDEREH